MKFRQLEYFCAVAEEKSISAAARELHVAQPPISRQIAQLEEELGVQLFLRGSKGMVLTDAGQNLYQQAQQIFQDLRRVEDSVRSVGTGMSGRIKLGVIYSAMPYALPYINRYHSKYPQVELFIRVGSPQELIEALNRGKVAILAGGTGNPFFTTDTGAVFAHGGARTERLAGAHSRRGRARAHHARGHGSCAGAFRGADRAARGCADVPSALGRPLELQRLSGAGVPAQRLYAECDLPLLRYAHGDADGALGLWHQLPAPLHSQHAPGRTVEGKACARPSHLFLCRFGVEQRCFERPVRTAVCRREEDLKKLSAR